MKSAKSKTTAAIQLKSESSNQSPFFKKEGEASFFAEQQLLSPFGGGQGVERQPFFSPSTIQPKLTIGQPNDKYEVEADQMADKVVQQLADPTISLPPSETNSSAPAIQHKCSDCEDKERIQKMEGEEEMISKKGISLQRKPIFESGDDEISASGAGIQRKCASCGREEADHIQEKSETNAPSTASSDLQSRLNSTKGGGSTLPKETASSMGDAFGSDFSGVRIHTDGQAVQMNQELGAHAFTHGSDIYFNSGKYDTNSTGGKHLLAHELTHTVQQVRGLRKKRIQRKDGDDKKPKTEESKSHKVVVHVQLDKDCSRMNEEEFKDYVFVLFLTQTFGFEKTISVSQQEEHNYRFSQWGKPKRRGKKDKVPINVYENGFRSILKNYYGKDDPRVELLVQSVFGGTSPLNQKELKEKTKELQLINIQKSLSPLEWAYLKEQYNLAPTSTDIEKSLEDLQKLVKELEEVKGDKVKWFKFLKTQMGPVEFYHRIAIEFKKLESLFLNTFFTQALAMQHHPWGGHWKTSMKFIYGEYPWVKQAEQDIRENAKKYTSKTETDKAAKQELNLNGFRDMNHYVEFVKMYMDSFRDVVVYKIEQQLNINEEIVNKEKRHYSSGRLAELQSIFAKEKTELETTKAERIKFVIRLPPYNQPHINPGHTERMFDQREKELNDKITRKRRHYSYAYPILDDTSLSNEELLTDIAGLKKNLLSVTAKRLSNIKKTRENLKNDPEKFVFWISDQAYVHAAMQELLIERGSLEDFFIKGRISKIRKDEEFEKIAIAALTIGLGLLSLPFSGAAAVIASIPGFALGIYSSVEEVKEYRVRMAAFGTAFNVKDSIVKEEPSLVWLIVSLAGTALEGLILAKAFASLSKSRYLKYGLPERQFIDEAEAVILKEAGYVEPDKLLALRKELTKKVEETEAFDLRLLDSAKDASKTLARVSKAVGQTKDIALIDKVAESVYWAIRRGITNSDDFLKEAPLLKRVEKSLVEACFKNLTAKMPTGKALKPSSFHEVLQKLYVDNGLEVTKIFVRNKKTNIGAIMTAVKKPNGQYVFLEQTDMTQNAQTIIKDIANGEKSLRLAKKSTLKGVNLNKVHTLGVPLKVLSDLPEVQSILSKVAELQKPLTRLRRQARGLRKDIDGLDLLPNASQQLKSSNTTKLARIHKELQDQGRQLIAQAEKLEKQATLITDSSQKVKLIKESSEIRREGRILMYNIKVQDAYNNRSLLRVALNTAAKFGDNALYYNAHHLIPHEMIEQSLLLRKAIEGGFDFNGIINGVNLPRFSSKFRTQNIVVELLEDGTKAKITQGKSVINVVVESTTDGKKIFKLNDDIVGELIYTRNIHKDGAVIEGGKISLEKGGETITETLKESPLGSHTSHPNYNQFVEGKLNSIEQRLGADIDPLQAKQEVDNLTKLMRKKIQPAFETSGVKIDDLFKP